MEDGTERKRTMTKMTAAALAALAVASAFLFFWRLGDGAYLDYDEAAYAEVVRDTVRSGDLMTLKIVGRNWFDKPPLFYWAGAGSQALLGENEFATRLPSALSGLLSVALAWFVAYELSRSPGRATLAAAILATTGAFVDASRQFRMDAMVTAVILFAFYCFVRGLRDKRWLVGFGAAVGIGVMVKSVIGLLAYPVALVAAVAFRRADWLRSRWFWAGQALAAAIAAPWHLYMTAKHGTAFWNWYFLTHVVERYGSNLLADNTSVLTYFSYLYTRASPWALMFAVVLLVFAINWRKFSGGERAGFVAAAGSALFVFAFFSTAQTKIPFYLVPMYPFAAIATALFMGDALDRARAGAFRTFIVGAMAILMLSGLYSAIDRGFRLDDRLDIEHRLAEDERRIGYLLRDSGAETVYFTEPMYDQTVRYYAGGKNIDVLERERDYPERVPLVVFTYLTRHDEYYKALASRSEVAFAGQHFSLLWLGPGRP